MRRSAALIPLIALFGAPGGGAQEPGSGPVRRYELPNLDQLELELPAGWRDDIDAPPSGGSPTIQLSPEMGAPFEVHIAPEWPASAGEPAPDSEALREAVRAQAERTRAQSVETTTEIRRLQGADGIGFYFRATESAPQDGEFRVMHQGALRVGRLTLWFSILTDEGQDATVAQALQMLASAVHRATGLDQR